MSRRPKDTKIDCTCPECGKLHQVPSSLCGRRAECHCGAEFDIVQSSAMPIEERPTSAAAAVPKPRIRPPADARPRKRPSRPQKELPDTATPRSIREKCLLGVALVALTATTALLADKFSGPREPVAELPTGQTAENQLQDRFVSLASPGTAVNGVEGNDAPDGTASDSTRISPNQERTRRQLTSQQSARTETATRLSVEHTNTERQTVPEVAGRLERLAIVRDSNASSITPILAVPFEGADFEPLSQIVGNFDEYYTRDVLAFLKFETGQNMASGIALSCAEAVEGGVKFSAEDQRSPTIELSSHLATAMLSRGERLPDGPALCSVHVTYKDTKSFSGATLQVEGFISSSGAAFGSAANWPDLLRLFGQVSSADVVTAQRSLKLLSMPTAQARGFTPPLANLEYITIALAGGDLSTWEEVFLSEVDEALAASHERLDRELEHFVKKRSADLLRDNFATDNRVKIWMRTCTELLRNAHRVANVESDSASRVNLRDYAMALFAAKWSERLDNAAVQLTFLNVFGNEFAGQYIFTNIANRQVTFTTGDKLILAVNEESGVTQDLKNQYAVSAQQRLLAELKEKLAAR